MNSTETDTDAGAPPATERRAVLFDIDGRVGVITINRPEARNAVNQAVALGLEAAIDRLEDDPDLWAGVITAAAPVFSAGADLKEIAAGRRHLLRTERGGFAGFVARNRTKPVIAAVDGVAFGGGAEICLACDLIVASTDASFALPEVKRGLVAAAGGLFRLPARLPRAIALELVMTGSPINARTAAQFGMVNRVTDPGQARAQAIELAHEITANAPLAVQASRRALLDACEKDDTHAWALSEKAMAIAMNSSDRQEGIDAFVQKRKPSWSGR